jgi:hypothetical protein
MISARSVAEAYLFVDLQTCACGQAVAQTHEMAQDTSAGGALRLTGRCSACGQQLTYEFALDDTAPLTGFGRKGPSTLIDPGGFLWAGDRAAAEVPVDVRDLTAQERSAARAQLEYAIDTCEEILAFVPDDADAVPQAAFTTELGRAPQVAEPQRFTRRGLTDRIASYRKGIDDLAAVSA